MAARTQAQWDKDRAAVKAKANKTVKANAKAAAKAKAEARAKRPGANNEDFLAKAQEVQDRIDAKNSKKKEES